MLQILGFTMIFRAMFVFAKVQLEAVGAFPLILLLSLADLGSIITILVLAGVLGWSPTMMVAGLAVEALCILTVAQWLAARRHPTVALAVTAPPVALDVAAVPETG